MALPTRSRTNERTREGRRGAVEEKKKKKK